MMQRPTTIARQDLRDFMAYMELAFMKWTKCKRADQMYGDKIAETGERFSHQKWLTRVSSRIAESGYGRCSDTALAAKAVTFRQEGYSALWPTDKVIEFDWSNEEDEDVAMPNVEQGVKRVHMITLRSGVGGKTEKSIPGMEGATVELDIQDAMRCHPHGSRLHAE